jgi:hypothetical protein
LSGNEGLSSTELVILRQLSKVSSIENLAKMVKVPPAVLGEELAKLQIGGFITNDGTLTERGTKAIKNA